jgi:cellulose synthase/poly-beta-1,6-N-acetylglucosamine synthase-like glycosyltransferase
MFLSPEVAIVQHHTSVYQVSGDFFENGATYFAKMCYAQIRFQVSNGECAPFVGHNAFVRWKALQDVAIDTGDPNYVMYWSEYHISEDFNMSIRLQSANWVTRYASYHQDEFKEQVSLTIYDEISRWERYSYGDSELLFNPIWTWLWRGPFTRLFRKFLFCDMHWSSKLSIISYMTSCEYCHLRIVDLRADTLVSQIMPSVVASSTLLPTMFWLAFTGMNWTNFTPPHGPSFSPWSWCSGSSATSP